MTQPLPKPPPNRLEGHLSADLWTTITVALLGVAVLVAAAVGAEEIEFSAPDTCPSCPVVVGDIAFQLYQDGAPIADPGVTLLEHPNGRDYTLGALPDAVAGSSTRYYAAWTIDGAQYGYAWPAETRTPQSLIFSSTFRPVPKVAQVAQGDTLPVPTLRVLGLASDPTGASATFSMQKGSDAAKVDAAAAVISDVDQAADLSWEMTLQYNWSATDTDTKGSYRGWFVVTFAAATCGPGGASPCISTFPPDRSMDIRITEP